MIVANGWRILVVDDEPNIVRLIVTKLRNHGYQVETANNGLQALAKIKDDKPDLLVSDVMMPEMTGLELSVAIRAAPLLASLPILLLTCKSPDARRDSIAESLASGADSVLMKPFNPDEMLATVNELLLNTPAKG